MNGRAGRIRGRSGHRGILLIPCQVNRAYRYWFLADTGAALTVLSVRVAKEVGIDLTRPFRHQQIA